MTEKIPPGWGTDLLSQFLDQVRHIEWLPPSAVGDEVVVLLPRGIVNLDRETEAALVRAFGTDGEFEARRG